MAVSLTCFCNPTPCRVQIDYKAVKFGFENLLGGGAIGDTANAAVNAVGEAVVRAQGWN